MVHSLVQTSKTPNITPVETPGTKSDRVDLKKLFETDVRSVWVRDTTRDPRDKFRRFCRSTQLHSRAYKYRRTSMSNEEQTEGGNTVRVGLSIMNNIRSEVDLVVFR